MPGFGVGFSVAFFFVVVNMKTCFANVVNIFGGF